MKMLLAVLLSLAQITSAAVPRVRVAPAPVGGGSAVLARPLVSPNLVFSPSAQHGAPTLANLSVGAAAAAPQLHSPLGVIPAPSPAPSFFPANHPLAAPPAAAPEAMPAALIQTLREHGGLAGAVSESGDAGAAEANFSAAAGLDAPSHRSRLLTGVAPAAVLAPAESPSTFNSLWRLLGSKGKGADKKAAAKVADRLAADPLYDRLLERVTLDDRGSPVERAALERTVRTMLRSPTARKYAEEFIAEGLTGVVRFSEVEGSKVYAFDGRKIFYAPRAFTEWKDGMAEVRLNRDYLDSDTEYFHEDAPPTLAHELLGHGLWYGRMAKQGLQELFHIHENNETNAKLVGWLAGWELNKRFHDTFAWEYLSDPARYLQNLKVRQPYYSITYTTEQMADPIKALEARLESVKVMREHYEHGLRNIRSWPPVIDHFITHHGVAEERFARLKEDVAQRDSATQGELANLDAIENALKATIEFYRSPDGAPGLEVLRSAGQFTDFDRLQSEVDAMTAELRETTSRQPAKPAAPPAAWPKGQISWEELQQMFEKDARENPAHWQRP